MGLSSHALEMVSIRGLCLKAQAPTVSCASCRTHGHSPCLRRSYAPSPTSVHVSPICALFLYRWCSDPI